MNLGWTFPWNSHIGAIEHWFFSGHIVIHNLEDDTKFTDNHLALVLLISEKGEVLTHSYPLDIG